MWQTIGHGKVVDFLRRSAAKEQVSHAYLLVGPAHVGKMTLSLDLAKALNCNAAEAPCGQCSACERIAAGKYPDVQVIDLPSELPLGEEKRIAISVKQVEDMQHDANLPPFEGKYKVFIINGAELMSTGAANRFLKTLEEPVGHVVFILLTNNEKLLLPTVISRCQKLELRPLPAAQVEAALVERSIESARAKLLARLSRGCPGWAISMAANDSLLAARTEMLDHMLEIFRSGFEERFAYAAKLATQFGQNRGAVLDLLELWLDWWHDLLLVKTGLKDGITNLDRQEALEKMAGNYELTQIRGVMRSIRAAGEQLKMNANSRLALEMLMLNIPVGSMVKHG